MIEQVFSKEQWAASLETLGSTHRVYVPVKEGDYSVFKPLENAKDADFSFKNTRLSPKSLMLPQSERIFEYSLDGSDEDAHILKEVPKDFSPQVIVGIRPCDAFAFQLVEANFNTSEYRDPWWTMRKKTTTLVGLGCNHPCSSCFCTSAGSGPFSEKGLDVLLYDLGEVFLARAFNQKGEDILGKFKGGKPADDSTRKAAQNLAKAAADEIVSSIRTDRLKDKDMNELFHATFWDEVAFSCINCGTCTFLCPTCWCFDIQDEVLKKWGDRIRNWDTCMSPLFTLHGSGHNPRDKKVQRVRQRFMHKLKYYVDKYRNGVQCVGCGRCVQFCPVNIDIRKVCGLMNDN